MSKQNHLTIIYSIILHIFFTIMELFKNCGCLQILTSFVTCGIECAIKRTDGTKYTNQNESLSLCASS